MRLSLILTASLFAPLAHSGVAEWIDSASTVAARGAYRYVASDCANAPAQEVIGRCEGISQDRFEAIRIGGEVGEGAYLAALGDERQPALSCLLTQVDDARSVASNRIKIEDDLAGKIEMIIALRRQAATIETEMNHQQQLGLAAQPHSAYYTAAASYNQAVAAEEAALGSIRFIETDRMKRLVRSLLERFNEGRGPSVTHDAILAAVRQTAAPALAGLSGDLHQEINELTRGSQSNGTTLSRSMRESLAQDRDLAGAFFERNSSLRDSLTSTVCRVDAAYGRGAQVRDRALIATEVGLTVATFGAGAIASGATAASAAGLQAAVRVGRVAQGLGRVLRGAGIAMDISAGASLIDRSCAQYQPQFRGRGRECREFSVEAIDADNCALNAVLTGLNLGALAGGPAMRFLRQAGANVFDRFLSGLSRAEANAVRAKIVELEGKGVSQERIQNALEQAGNQCR